MIHERGNKHVPPSEWMKKHTLISPLPGVLAKIDKVELSGSDWTTTLREVRLEVSQFPNGTVTSFCELLCDSPVRRDEYKPLLDVEIRFTSQSNANPPQFPTYIQLGNWDFDRRCGTNQEVMRPVNWHPSFYAQFDHLLSAFETYLTPSIQFTWRYNVTSCA